MKTRNRATALAGVLFLSTIFTANALDEIPDNLGDWNEEGAVLQKKSSEHDQWWIEDCIKVGGTYYLFFKGGPKSCWGDGSGHTCIFLARSSDGKNFTRHSDPIIRPEQAVYVSSWEHGVRTGAFTHKDGQWIAYVGVDHSGNKTPGMKPQSEWACDVSVDATIFAFTSNDAVNWSLKGEVGGVFNQGEMHPGNLIYHNGTFYCWPFQAEPNMKQAATKGSNYMNLNWQGWIDALNYGWSDVEAFIHDDNNTVTLIYWPFGGGHPGEGKDVYFATSSLNNMTSVSNKRVVCDNVGWQVRHSIVKDVAGGKWRWYYSVIGSIRMRTAPLEGQPQDNTPPSAPSNLSASASGRTRIDLSWDAASDGESGIGGYTIYRDGDNVGTSSETSYSDTDLNEGTEYTYRVSAVNGAGMEGEKSGEASATTGSDENPPKLSSVAAQSATSVKVVFNEPVTKASAEKTGNYEISDGIGVSGASLDGDNTSVMLTVSTLTLKKTYTLNVSNITDRAATPNTGGDQKQFSYSGEVGISNLTVASGASYEIVKGIAEGDKQYIDRGYTFNSLGEYAGMTYIRTANDDKEATDEDFLTFDLSAPATLFVAYRHGTDLPPWLSSWTKTGSEVCGDGCSDVYEKDMDAGTITLGGNKPGGAGNMYGVFIDAGGDATIAAAGSERPFATTRGIRASFLGSMLRVTGLYPMRDYTLTLTDARGRVSSVRKASGPGGMLSISAATRSRGVYVVQVHSKGHSSSITAVLP